MLEEDNHHLGTHIKTDTRVSTVTHHEIGTWEGESTGGEGAGGREGAWVNSTLDITPSDAASVNSIWGHKTTLSDKQNLVSP